MIGKTVKIKVAITDTMQIGFFVEGDATEEEGRAALEQLIAALGTENVTVKNVLPIEKHRDDTRLQAVHDLTHNRNHRH